jgi:hypothetical protein
MMAMTGLLVVGLLVTLALLAPRYGADSRDGRDWSNRIDRLGPRGDRHTLRADLRRLTELVSAAWQRQERAWAAVWAQHQPGRGDIAPDTPPAGKPRAHTD